MNRGLTTSFTRMVCSNGHDLRWRGRWEHTVQTIELPVVDPFDGTVAKFPHTYYHLDRKGLS